MKLGAFSVSLTVKDLKTSKDFYEKLGFSVFGGQMEHNYLIMKNGTTLVGLFQGMFPKNILTFNPRWDHNCTTQGDDPDVRKIHAALKEQGVATEQESLDGESGPGSFVTIDPDGNPILFDQHV